MKIAISTLVTPPAISGVGHYIQRLTEALQQVDPENEYILLVSEETQDIFPVNAPNFSHVVLPFRHDPRWLMRPLYFIWQNLFFRSFAKKHGVDVLHIPNLVPVVSSSIPTVMTLHDLAEYHTTRYSSKLRQMYRRLLPKLVVRSVNKVITISEHSKQDLVDLCNAPPERIRVIYEAAGVSKSDSHCDPEPVLGKYGIKDRFLLYVGKALPHKNLEFLLRSFARLLQSDAYNDVQLVLAGGMGRDGDELRKVAEELGISSNVIFTGYVQESELTTLYSTCLFFVFPSLYEGFGLPLLEAMQFGAPILAAQSSCLPEIAGEAALYADPNDEAEWMEQMGDLINQDGLRRSLREKGEKRWSQFSWKKCATETIEVYREVFSDGD